MVYLSTCMRQTGGGLAEKRTVRKDHRYSEVFRTAEKNGKLVYHSYNAMKRPKQRGECIFRDTCGASFASEQTTSLK